MLKQGQTITLKIITNNLFNKGIQNFPFIFSY